MKYFYDFEFSAHFKKQFEFLPSIRNFNKPFHTIELISVGIIAEDEREYFAVSNEFDPYEVADWVRDNVLTGIVKSYEASLLFGEHKEEHTSKLLDKPVQKQIKLIQKWVGQSNSDISAGIARFINPDLGWPISAYDNSAFGKKDSYETKHFDKHDVGEYNGYFYAQPEFYGYYCDYDWVLFCSLFGTMMQLPKGFPMYSIDLKQIIDEHAKEMLIEVGTKVTHDTKKEMLAYIETSQSYPKQDNEHHALDDAKWNKELYHFLKADILKLPLKQTHADTEIPA